MASRIHVVFVFFLLLLYLKISFSFFSGLIPSSMEDVASLFEGTQETPQEETKQVKEVTKEEFLIPVKRDLLNIYAEYKPTVSFDEIFPFKLYVRLNEHALKRIRKGQLDFVSNSEDVAISCWFAMLEPFQPLSGNSEIQFYKYELYVGKVSYADKLKAPSSERVVSDEVNYNIILICKYTVSEKTIFKLVFAKNKDLANSLGDKMNIGNLTGFTSDMDLMFTTAIPSGDKSKTWFLLSEKNCNISLTINRNENGENEEFKSVTYCPFLLKFRLMDVGSGYLSSNVNISFTLLKGTQCYDVFGFYDYLSGSLKEDPIKTKKMTFKLMASDFYDQKTGKYRKYVEYPLILLARIDDISALGGCVLPMQIEVNYTYYRIIRFPIKVRRYTDVMSITKYYDRELETSIKIDSKIKEHVSSDFLEKISELLNKEGVGIIPKYVNITSEGAYKNRILIIPSLYFDGVKVDISQSFDDNPTLWIVFLLHGLYIKNFNLIEKYSNIIWQRLYSKLELGYSVSPFLTHYLIVNEFLPCFVGKLVRFILNYFKENQQFFEIYYDKERYQYIESLADSLSNTINKFCSIYPGSSSLIEGLKFLVYLKKEEKISYLPELAASFGATFYDLAKSTLLFPQVPDYAESVYKNCSYFVSPDYLSAHFYEFLIKRSEGGGKIGGVIPYLYIAGLVDVTDTFGSQAKQKACYVSFFNLEKNVFSNKMELLLDVIINSTKNRDEFKNIFKEFGIFAEELTKNVMYSQIKPYSVLLPYIHFYILSLLYSSYYEATLQFPDLSSLGINLESPTRSLIEDSLQAFFLCLCKK